MAITFVEKAKRQRYLIFVFSLVILITAFILWRGYFAEKPPEKPILKPSRKIEIDFEVLKNPILEKFQPVEKIEEIKEGIGRETPFLPY